MLIEDNPSPPTPASGAPHLWIKGLGPAGALLAFRAAARGWRVTGCDPRVESTQRLPAWPATYGLLDSEVPVWARDFVSAPIELRTVTCSERPAPFRYCMLNKEALRTAVEAVGIRITSDLRPPHDATMVADCTGAPTDSSAYWQLAVGIVLPYSFLRDATPSPIFMDWSATTGRPPSFLYVQHLERGVLFEETVLATGLSPHAVIPELERRIEARLDEHFRDWRSHALPDRETVVIPMGTRRARFLSIHDFSPTPTNTSEDKVLSGASTLPRIYFGAAGGMINPATGYSVGGAMSQADACLDSLESAGGYLLSGTERARGRIKLHRKANAELAFYLRRLGSELISRADGPTLSSFFDAFFTLDLARQLAYLTGHDGIGVMASMWAMRSIVGWRHPFLMPLWKTPRQVLRAVLKNKR
ncbi:hypothetical protein GSS87_04070 [Corynebacterium sp. 4HC-13]|uniref:lycopene cyclase family protein n=1 Tax=Corynebacterium anserum TaxID=2684406 RepID=UPI00163ABDD0|nr:lycopene cyclase family protein [Corynebacterium anserum]MBC2681578.1 hypothetical protein [Corynebacterium anserum]